jgi:general transcription factor IIIA
LDTHHNISHLGKRDFICHHEDCGKAYGYKHLLQRHLAKAHASWSSSHHSDSEDDTQLERKPMALLDIDTITGKSYMERIKTKSSLMVQCPYPRIPITFKFDATDMDALSNEHVCKHVFSRAYDLRRHLRSGHRMEVEKEAVDSWVRSLKHSLL